MKKMQNLESGFTFVELLVVIIILGVIATISIVAFGNSHRNAIRNSCKTAYQSNMLAVQAYQSDNNGQLPASLISMAPTYVNSNLIDTGVFVLELQQLKSGFNLLVTDSRNATAVRTGTLTSADVNNFTFLISDTSKISKDQTVMGSGISSLFSTNANFLANSTTLNLDSVDGISVGMNVIGTGISNGTTVTSIDLTKSNVTLSTPTTSSGANSGIVFGSSPKVFNVDPTTGTVTLTGTSVLNTPKLNKKYILVFGGSTIPGTAPLSCQNL